MVITRHGGPEVFTWQERPKPLVNEFDVLVQVRATSITPVDSKLRSGYFVTRHFPLILGYDVSGIVVEAGDRVSKFQIGDEVYASLNILRDGANAEYVAADSRSIALKPKTIDHATAAILPRAAIAAWEALHQHARVQPGQTVLIHAGAGGVGHLAVQLAKSHGCHTIVTASRKEAMRFCRDTLKADEVIDYKSMDFVQQVMSISPDKGHPIVIETNSNDLWARSLDGMATSPQLPPSEEKLFLKKATQYHESVGFPAAYKLHLDRQRQILSLISELVDSAQLVPHIAYKLKLSEVARGHALQESGNIIGTISVEL
ncbi:NADP-dependent oxidoreductase [Oscillatoria sp. FACHB-1406]|uniref:quinone oxidoreductase family protein n=1 Tax=Oscillatoria sp. FACHB-1406 TaxID=2692846 RepID=UPI0016886E58|nr:NADP-dependent oxidoreductase [Oscillatoria sp. FACHB-1406]MBD2578895.1 NADP-dependent oxidoreductase [Oscillatoria sp. FACHB-1406]